MIIILYIKFDFFSKAMNYVYHHLSLENCLILSVLFLGKQKRKKRKNAIMQTHKQKKFTKIKPKGK